MLGFKTLFSQRGLSLGRRPPAAALGLQEQNTAATEPTVEAAAPAATGATADGMMLIWQAKALVVAGGLRPVRMRHATRGRQTNTDGSGEM